MKAPTNYNRIQILAATGLASLAVAVAWSASASAYPVSGPIIRPADSSAQTTPQEKALARSHYPTVGGASSGVQVKTSQLPSAKRIAATSGPYGGSHPGLASSGPAATNPSSALATREAAPSTGTSTDTLPIVLASVALLLAAGGVGFTVIAAGRTRRSLQPGA